MVTSTFTSKLQGKKVVIVGGSSGIGFSVAQACLEFGAQVVIASSNQQRVDEAVKRLQASTSDASKVSGKTINLSRGSEGPSSIDKRVEEFLKSVGKFDHYVHSAGENLSFGPISEVDFEAADRMFDVRYFGPMAAAKAISKHGLMNEGGSMTLTTGTVYLKPHEGWSMIAGVAGAVVSLTRALAVDLAPLRVNCVSPGPVKTELWDGVPKDQLDKMLEGFKKSSLTDKVAMPEDTAESYLGCMRDGSLTGQTIVTEGGMLLKS